jgi:hypothetical protein
MSYTLKSINHPDHYRCDDEFWLGLLETARRSGWRPEGTRYDLAWQIDELFDEGADDMYNLFMVVLATQWRNSWDGNYHERENQFLTDEDVHYLKLALEGAGVNPSFMAFLDRGSFRICSL